MVVVVGVVLSRFSRSVDVARVCARSVCSFLRLFVVVVAYRLIVEKSVVSFFLLEFLVFGRISW